MLNSTAAANTVMGITDFNDVLASYKIKAECLHGFTIKHMTFFDLTLAPGARIRDIEKYSKELALKLQSKSLLIKPIPEKGIVRLEFATSAPKAVDLFSELQKATPPAEMAIPLYIGESAEGSPMWIDLHRCPHLLIAGASGSGKSTLLHSIVANCLLHKRMHLHLFDTKSVEFARYADMNRTNVKISNYYADCLQTLKDIHWEMNERYEMMKEHHMPGNYFATAACVFTYKVVIIDEFADLIMQDDSGELKSLICKIAQKGRAAGIHLVVATQRPSVDVIDGTIKANFPARIACKVSSGVDSKVILDTQGAELLLGQGDAIVKSAEYDFQRFQSAYTTSEDVYDNIGEE
jgi:S-DNA-T family DNA segregation ATPase FtsK/SpoIIIE